MKTTRKNARGQKFTCAHCGKNFQNAQGLSGHIRYQHPDGKVSVKSGEGRHDLQVKASSPAANTGAHGHLQAAFAMLSQRDREIEEEIARLQSLTAEKEIIRRELDAVKSALAVLSERESDADTEAPAGAGKDTPLHTEDGKTSNGKGPEFTGNKTDFVRALVEFRGAAGATPKDIDQVFTQRRIEKSKNAIYNALDSLVRQNKLKKKDGQYFFLGNSRK